MLRDISKVLPCYSSIGFRTRSTNFKNNHQTATLRFYNKEFRNLMSELGLPVGKKSNLIKPPNGAYSKPDYVRGLIDGDGSIGFTKTGTPFIGFVTASSYMARYYEGVLLSVCGVERHTNKNKRDGVYNILTINRSAVKLAEWCWYKPEVLSLRRKSDTAAKLILWRAPSGKGGRFGIVRKRWSFEEDNIVRSYPANVASELLGRSLSSVSSRKWRLDNSIN